MLQLLKIPIFCWKESLKQLKIKQKNKKEDISDLLRNLLSGKGIVRAASGNNKGKGSARSAYGKEWNV